MRHAKKLVAVCLLIAGLTLVPTTAYAITAIPDPSSGVGSFGIEATKPQPPPQTTATIASPSNGASYTTSPITVTGSCTVGLLVQVYDNSVLAGAANCTSGSFSLQVTLFTGQNDIDAYQYDDLNQASPDSNHVTVTYNNASTTAFGTLITLTSNYGRMAADPGATLNWPLLLSGGTGPYAFSINWGDGSPPTLQPQATSGQLTVSHVYNQSGIYQVTVKVTDANGVTAFLQLVGVANGQPAASATGSSSSGSNKSGTTTAAAKVDWAPAAATVVLLVPSFWLGRRSELVSLHRKLEHDMENYRDL